MASEELHKWVRYAKAGLLAFDPCVAGWNSWYNFWCNYSEKRIQQTVDVIVSSGLAAAGYQYGSCSSSRRTV